MASVTGHRVHPFIVEQMLVRWSLSQLQSTHTTTTPITSTTTHSLDEWQTILHHHYHPASMAGRVVVAVAMWRDSLRMISHIGFVLVEIRGTGPCRGASTGFMVASGGVLSEGYGHEGPGACLGDGQTEAEGVPSQCALVNSIDHLWRFILYSDHPCCFSKKTSLFSMSTFNSKTTDSKVTDWMIPYYSWSENLFELWLPLILSAHDSVPSSRCDHVVNLMCGYIHAIDRHKRSSDDNCFISLCGTTTKVMSALIFFVSASIIFVIL